jgi:hypothetical protein
MRKTGGGGLSANFANFREIFGRRFLAADNGEIRTSNFEPCNPKLNPELPSQAGNDLDICSPARRPQQ